MSEHFPRFNEEGICTHPDHAKEEAERPFIEEVERRAGAKRDVMLRSIELIPLNVYTLWLRRILGESK